MHGFCKPHNFTVHNKSKSQGEFKEPSSHLSNINSAEPPDALPVSISAFVYNKD